MAKSTQGIRARVSQTAGRRRKKPTNRVDAAFNDVKKLVSDVGDRFFGSFGQRGDATKKGSAKKSAAERKRRGQKRQAAAKNVGASRIRSGKQRQAAAKKAARTRGAKTS